MSEVIVVASGKGGTGKTTVCAGLAAALAKNKKRVLIIDCDSGMRGVDMVLGISDRLVYDFADVVSGACEAKEALYQIDGDFELYTIAAPLYADDEVSPSLVKNFVDKVRDDFDYILIDSPAGTGSGFVAAAASADRALVVINPEPISIRGCKNIGYRLEELGISDRRLIINRFDRERFFKMGLYKDLDEVIDEAGVRLIGVIPEDIRVIALAQRGALTNNWSQTGIIFETIVKRLEGVDVPIIIKNS
ncbi:AAA family ATPase [uncultured Ruminococcus sp.]|uniref:AAA family ATPase n=1 Tax=uncultured Ruminococcus sp. TaxID=165186 RepID=UPI00292EEA68|nr:AAA family ATPase [uncultured Ruminococcus sp.]